MSQLNALAERFTEIQFAVRSLVDMIDNESPAQIKERCSECIKLMESIKRLHFRRNYELMVPTVLLHEGKTFGEQALQNTGDDK